MIYQVGDIVQVNPFFVSIYSRHIDFLSGCHEIQRISEIPGGPELYNEERVVFLPKPKWKSNVNPGISISTYYLQLAPGQDIIE